MTTFEYTFEGTVPSKKNSKTMVCYGKRPILLPSKAYKAWHGFQETPLQWARDDQGIVEPIEEVKYIQMNFYAGDQRKYDLTNKAESIMDIMVDFKILKDDNWSVVPEVVLSFKGVEKKEARVEVKIVYKTPENAVLGLSEDV